MSRHAITPSDKGRSLPANPLWQRSPPVTSKDGRIVWIDATVLSNIAAHNAAADARNGKSGGWGRG